MVRMMGFPYDFEPEGTAIVESVASVRFVIAIPLSSKQDSVVAPGNLYSAAYKQASE